MSLSTDNASLSTASPLLTRSPPHCSPHQPPRLRYALGLFAFSWLIKKETERGKDTSAQTKFRGWQLAYELPTLVEWQRRLNLNVGEVLLEEQVRGLEETWKRKGWPGGDWSLTGPWSTAGHQCDLNRPRSQNSKTS